MKASSHFPLYQEGVCFIFRVMARNVYCFCVFLLLLTFVTSGSRSSSHSQKSTSNSTERCSNTTTGDPSYTTCNGSLSRGDKQDSVVWPPKTVEQFCIVAKISPANCSCAKSSEVCDMERYIRFERLNQDYILVIFIEVTTVMVLGVVGNSAVLLSSYQRRNTLSPYKIVIAFLAFTDGISSVLNFIHTGPIIWSEEKWTFGVPLCKIIFTGFMACSWLSSGFILLIGVERYCGILYPLKGHSNKKKRVYGCSVLNVMATLCAGIPMLIYTTVNSKERCHTDARREILVIYHSVLIALFMVMPICALIFIYFRIIFHLHRMTHDNAAVSERKDIQLKREKENRQAMMILLPVVGAFIICILPINVIDLYWASFKVNGAVGIDPLLYLDLWLVHNICYPLHACINPIIYTCVDPEFRKSLRSMFGLKRRNGSQPSHNSRPVSSVISSTSF